MTTAATNAIGAWQSLLGEEPREASRVAPALFAGEIGQRLVQRAVPATEPAISLFIRAVVRSGAVRLTAIRGDAAAPVLDLAPSSGSSIGAALGLTIEVPGGVTQLVLDSSAPGTVIELHELAYRAAPASVTGQTTDPAPTSCSADDATGGGSATEDGDAKFASHAVPVPEPRLASLLDDDFTRPLLSVAIPDEATRSTVFQRLEQHDEIPALWQELGSDASTAQAAEDLKYALSLAPLVDYDLATIRELFRQRREGQQVGLDDLAGLAARDWTELLAASDPESSAAEDRTSRSSRLARAFEQARPSAAFNRRAVRNEAFGSAVTAFLREHPTADLGTDNVDQLARKTANATAGSPSTKAPEEVRAIQRLYKLSPRLDHVSALHATGFRSANDIARAGRASFIRRQASALGGDGPASEVFERAARVSLAATAIVADHGPAATAALPRVLQATADAVTGPDWEQLFGDQLSFAGVEDWRSVFSQAAYLTDLFSFLDSIDSNVTGSTALDELLGRRPDLQWLTLGSANTNVAVAYIDLVNELLESAVLSHPPPPAWVPGYPDSSDGTLPAGAIATTGDEGWDWVTDPGQSSGTVVNSHTSPAAAGEHQHGFTAATATLSVAPGDLLVAWVYLDPQNPPDEIMLQWTVDASDAEHRAYWTDLREEALPGITQGTDGTASRWPMGNLPDRGRWTRLVVPAGDVGLENTQITGMSLLVFTDQGADPDNPNKGGAWWGSASATANAPPVETAGSADTLATTPQVITPAAYEILSGAVYAQQTLPLDLGIETTRLALGQLNIQRHQIMEAFDAGPRGATLVDANISAEMLGLTPAERKIIDGTDGNPEPTHWGLTVDPGAPDQWFKDLMVAEEFLARSGLTLDQMQTPPGVGLSYGFGLDLADPNDPSSLTVIGVGENSLPDIRRFLRLWRKLGWPDGDLGRIIHDVGPKDPVGKWPTILDPLLVTLALMRRLQTLTGLAPVTTMSLWTGVLDGKGITDPATYPPNGPLAQAQSPYAQLFLNSSTGPPNPVFLLNADQTELADPTQTIESQLPAVSAVLGLSAGDITLLANSALSGVPGAPEGLAEITLDLATLSGLHRCATLAKAMQLSIAEFLTLREITGIDTFAAAALAAGLTPGAVPDPDIYLPAQANTVAFVEARNDIQASNMATAQLAYILGDIITPGDATTPTAQQVETILADLQGILVSIVEAHPVAPNIPPDPTGQLTLSQLSSLPGLTAADQAIAALNGSLIIEQSLAALPADLPDLSSQPLSYDAGTKELSFTEGAMTTVARDGLKALSTDTAYQTAVDGLFAASREPVASLLSQLELTQPTVENLVDNLPEPENARFAALLGPVNLLVQRSLAQPQIASKISSAVGIDLGLSTQLLTDWLHVGDDQSSAMNALFALGDGNPVDGAGHAAAHEAVVKFFKVSQLISGFGLSRDEVTHAFTIGPKHGWLDPDKLPVTQSAADFTGWQQLAAYVRLRNSLSDIGGVLIGVFASADLATDQAAVAVPVDILQQLSDAFGWPASTASDAASALGLQYPSDFLNQDAVARLANLVSLATSVGANVSWLQQVAAADLDPSIGLAAWSTLAAHYDPASWESIGATVQDTLRERRRDALAGYIGANPTKLGLTTTSADSDAIFGQLLVDVEMGSCRSSSRLDLAINSVQLFLQRCQLGLEPNVTLTADDVQSWTWMSDYQVWAADRQTFVYPENYLDPTLRTDVTELFDDLQKQLQQADLSTDAAADALLGYLDGLDEIANLEPSAVIREVKQTKVSGTDSSGQAVETYTLTLGATHVVSRTRSSPRGYFYRSYTTDPRWTPWEKIAVQIDSDNLVPAWLNGQLYVFWTEPLDTAAEQVPSDTNSGHEPSRSRNLTLAWTRRVNGQWAGKQISPVSVDQGTNTYNITSSSLVLQGDPVQAAIYPSDTYSIRMMWVLNPNAGPGTWLVDPRGWFEFSPGTLAVDTTEDLNPGPDIFSVDTAAPGTLPPGTYYYVVTAISPELGESGPSVEAIGGPTTTAANHVVRWPADVPGSYRVYKGTSPGAEVVYFDINGVPDSGQIRFVDSGQPASGPGTPPPPEGRLIFDVPQAGLTPEGQATIVGGDGNLTVGLVSWSNDPTQLWSGAHADVLTGLTSVSSRVLASPFQADAADAAPPGADGFLPLYGLFVEIGDRSFFVVQDPDIYTIVSTQPSPDTVTRSVTPAAERTSTLAKEIGRAFSSQGPAPVLPAIDPTEQVRFMAAYHPWVKALIEQLRIGGVPGLLSRALQLTPGETSQSSARAFDFATYVSSAVTQPYPTDEIDFSFGGMYSTYNWELFFHIPLLLARGLMNNQQFSDARAWLQYIFDPTDASTNPAPQKYWQTAGLFNYFTPPGGPDPSIDSLLSLVADPNADQSQQQTAQQQVSLWRGNPTDPDGLARLRLSAYMKNVVMTYLDNLIAWGDELFNQGTAETITQATQLYVLASQLLGPAPDLGSIEKTRQPYSLVELRGKLGEFSEHFSDPLVNVENWLAVWTTPANSPAGFDPAPVPTLSPMLYFGVPVNAKLVSYWATVEDRLFKVRHCLDLQGQPATIPEFGPPIAPGSLIAGAFGAAGSAAEPMVELPQYRFGTSVQKALELCGEVKALGASLLSAIEKRDAEALARIRSGQEVQVLQAARAVKQRQVDDAGQAITVLQRTQAVTQARQAYYLGRPFLNAQENQQLGHLQTAASLQTTGQTFEVLGAALSLIPQAAIGVAGAGGSPQVNASFGGQQLSEITQTFSRYFSLLASVESHQANMAGLMGGFSRRQDDWTFQAEQAGKELDQIAAQILGAQIRQDIAQRELDNHDLQITNAATIDSFLTSKFSSAELYEWMIGQVSTVYSQSYQLALDMARRAERAYRYELGIYDASFVQANYWNSLSKGLLAGEQLAYDLHRMESAYLENNRREFEITKHISLALIDPVSLLKLRQTGECFIDVPEALFDVDYPGHYLRRIKSLAVTLPCVTGPYGGVNCTVTMTQNRVRLTPDTTSGYAYQGSGDSRFADQIAASQSIVTSSGVSDAGLFETNLRDERYLPFEGAGAISRWRVELPTTTNRLRRDSITDFVLHIRYTARDGGPTLQQAAQDAIVSSYYKTGLRLLSLRQNLTDRWTQYAAWAASTPTTPLEMTLEVTPDLFPTLAPPDIGITQVQVLLMTSAALPMPTPPITVATPNGAATTTLTLTPNPALQGVPQGAIAPYDTPQPMGEWTITFPPGLAPLSALDVIIILTYGTPS
jgi:hypothetical protein